MWHAFASVTSSASGLGETDRRPMRASGSSAVSSDSADVEDALAVAVDGDSAGDASAVAGGRTFTMLENSIRPNSSPSKGCTLTRTRSPTSKYWQSSESPVAAGSTTLLTVHTYVSVTGSSSASLPVATTVIASFGQFGRRLVIGSTTTTGFELMIVIEAASGPMTVVPKAAVAVTSQTSSLVVSLAGIVRVV